MRGNDFLNKMELVNPAFVEVADKKPITRKRSRALRAALALAACLCFVAGVLTMILQDRTKAKISYNCKDLPQNMPAGKVDLLTEEEIFSRKNMYVFRGKVNKLTNLTIDFNGEKEMRCLATIEIQKVYQGDISTGKKIKMLIPFPIGTDIWLEDAHIISQIEPGMEGIFMPWIYNENSYWEQNHATLIMSELAPCGLADGIQWAFLSTDQGLVFDKRAYPGAENAVTLDDIEAYVIKNLK